MGTEKDSWVFSEITFCQRNAVKTQVVICKRLTEMMELNLRKEEVGAHGERKSKNVVNWKF